MSPEIDYERLFVDAVTAARLDLVRRANAEAKLVAVQAETKPAKKRSLPVNLNPKTPMRLNIVGEK